MAVYTTIDDPTIYFNTKLHTGDGGGSGSSTGIGFQPNMVWSKSRTEALNHTMFDSVRGAGSNKELTPNGTSAEGGADSAGFGFISAFNSDGYSWTAGSTNTENFNKSSQTYANWCWKAGTSFTNDASATGIGSIDSSGSVNTDAGFSIISYTGTGSAGTIAHGLGSAPAMIINKKYSTTENWFIYHKGLGNNKSIQLNSTAASYTTGNWGNTDPTSSVFSLSTTDTNTSGATYINYCFAEKKGYSKFGSYTGNGTADGVFVYLGFRPAWVMWKKTSATANWAIRNNKMDPHNPSDNNLFANLTLAESSSNDIDFLSNGFKLRTAGSNWNTSSQTYIYIAFAENPFVNSNGVPGNAR